MATLESTLPPRERVIWAGSKVGLSGWYGVVRRLQALSIPLLGFAPLPGRSVPVPGCTPLPESAPPETLHPVIRRGCVGVTVRETPQTTLTPVIPIPESV